MIFFATTNLRFLLTPGHELEDAIQNLLLDVLTSVNKRLGDNREYK
jgi:hypothetical protein